MTTFAYRWTLVPPRFWLHAWHWRHWSLTVCRGETGARCGTWQLWLGPLVITRYFKGEAV